MDAAVAALRREQVMVTKITPAKAREAAAVKLSVPNGGRDLNGLWPVRNLHAQVAEPRGGP